MAQWTGVLGFGITYFVTMQKLSSSSGQGRKAIQFQFSGTWS